MRLSVFCALIASTAACGGVTEEAERGLGREGSVEVSSALYFASVTRWDRQAIEVCWENPGAFESERELVRAAITESWSQVTPIEFTGWGQCSASATGVRIRIKNDSFAVMTHGLGKELDGRVNGLELNFQFDSWATSCKSSELTRRSCIRDLAIHEFGHVLGFDHEHRRPDFPGECAPGIDGFGGTPADTLLGPYDPESVMNYCSPVRDRLSTGDMLGVQEVYGTLPLVVGFFD